MAVNPNGTRIAVTGIEGSLPLRSYPHGIRLRQLEPFKVRNLSLAVSFEDRWLAGASPSQVLVWNILTGHRKSFDE